MGDVCSWPILLQKSAMFADRGYYSSEEILACENEGITVTLPKPMTSGAKRFGKQDFRYVAEEDVYICPAGKRLAYSFTTQEHGLVLHRYLTNVCQHCAIKHRCTTGKERRITRWEHEHVLEAVQRLAVIQRCGRIWCSAGSQHEAAAIHHSPRRRGSCMPAGSACAGRTCPAHRHRIEASPKRR